MNSEIFNLFGISIRWYSVLILLGVLIAYLLAYFEGKKHDLPKDFILDAVFYAVIFGIIGARLYYVMFNLSYYKSNWTEIFAVWNGGLAIHGGLIFAKKTLQSLDGKVLLTILFL